MNPPPATPPGAEVAGIVVTYFPDEEFAPRLAAIVRETPLTIVVDNSADETARGRLRSICAQHGARLIEPSGNRGLGAALNAALAHLDKRVEWVIAFDQDSTPQPGLRQALVRVAADAGEKIAVVGANWHDEARPDFPARHLRRHPWLPLCFERIVATEDRRDLTCVITSGSLFHLSTVRALGGFEEDLFLDLTDTSFCLRARAAGYAVGVAAGAHLAHRRGAKRPVQRLGRTWWPAFMPPSRLHYLFRSRILVLRRVGWRFPHWVAFEVVYAAKILAEILLLEDQKAAKLAACWTGTWDGLLGRTGKLA